MAVSQSGSRTFKYAAQSDQETGTEDSAPINPSVQQFHPTAIKGWVVFDTTDDIIDDSFNVSSLTNIATGQADISWDTDFSSSTSYICHGSANFAHTGPVNFDQFSAGASRLLNYDSGSSNTDGLVAAFALGDQ